jgi:membrane-associated protease RseP (regulator of RpoE activity)
MAVVADEKGTRFLVEGGDAIFQEGDSHPVGVVRAVRPVDLSIVLSQGGREVRVLPGRPIPGARGLIVRDVVLVTTLEYRHRLVDRGSRKTLGGDLYLIGLRGTRAILQRDVDPPSPPTAPMEQRLAAIQIVQVAPRVWEVNARDIQTAMDSGEALINRALNESRMDISRTYEIGVELKTPLADVRVDRRGFVVTSPNLASRAGLEVGDRILGVNGMPIDGLGALVRAYRGIKNDPSIRTVHLTIERHEQPLTLTYQAR